jgi:hypothetical protein
LRSYLYGALLEERIDEDHETTAKRILMQVETERKMKITNSLFEDLLLKLIKSAYRSGFDDWKADVIHYQEYGGLLEFDPTENFVDFNHKPPMPVFGYKDHEVNPQPN